MHKQWMAILFVGILLFGNVFLIIPVSASVGVSAKSAILMEADSGSVLYEKDADTRRGMASTTKIMTALLAIESGRMSEKIIVDARAVGVEGSSIYLYCGETITLENLVYALLLSSANDAAEAIAYALCGSVEAFADAMNEKASSLGLWNTHFQNPHGLTADGHFTTARDLAKLTVYALQNETFLQIVSTYRKTIPLESKSTYRLLLNHNKLLLRYDGAIGVKTGYTKQCGRCLVSAAQRDGVRLVCVTLQDPDDWLDHTNLLNYGFSRCRRFTLAPEETLTYSVPVVGGTSETVTVRNHAPLTGVLTEDSTQLKAVTELDRFYYAPITKGQKLGKTVFYANGKVIGEAELYADADVPQAVRKRTFWEWVHDLLLSAKVL